MRLAAKWIVTAALVGGVSIPAFADDYSITFTDTSGSGQNATGTFIYSGGTFSNFDVSWNSFAFDLTLGANADSNAGGCSGGPGVSTFNYLEGAAGCVGTADQWGTLNGPSKVVNFIVSPNYSGFSGSANVPGSFPPNSGGSFTVTDLTPQAAPEIGPASAASGLTLLLGALAVLRGRKQQSIAA